MCYVSLHMSVYLPVSSWMYHSLKTFQRSLLLAVAMRLNWGKPWINFSLVCVTIPKLLFGIPLCLLFILHENGLENPPCDFLAEIAEAVRRKKLRVHFYKFVPTNNTVMFLVILRRPLLGRCVNFLNGKLRSVMCSSRWILQLTRGHF